MISLSRIRLRMLATALLAVSGIALAPRIALAVPSFSDQTGEACSACHVGSFGPQLNAHGRQFKLTGYADGQNSRMLPLLSGMAEGSFTHTAKDQAGGAAKTFGSNDNVAADQVSLFVAGRIYGHLGMFSQTTWDGVEHRVALDNTDVRYGRETQFGPVEAIVGASVNNNPTVSDPYNTTPAWGFPYASSALAPAPAAATLIDGGLAQRVVGASVYGLFGNLLYAEAGAYRSLSAWTEDKLGVAASDGPTVKGAAPYWRLALQHETLSQSFELGTFGLVSNVYPGNDRTAGTDRFTDIGIDAGYQWHATRQHVFSAYGSSI